MFLLLALLLYLILDLEFMKHKLVLFVGFLNREPHASSLLLFLTLDKCAIPWGKMEQGAGTSFSFRYSVIPLQ